MDDAVGAALTAFMSNTTMKNGGGSLRTTGFSLSSLLWKVPRLAWAGSPYCVKEKGIEKHFMTLMSIKSPRWLSKMSNGSCRTRALSETGSRSNRLSAMPNFSSPFRKSLAAFTTTHYHFSQNKNRSVTNPKRSRISKPLLLNQTPWAKTWKNVALNFLDRPSVMPTCRPQDLWMIIW